MTTTRGKINKYLGMNIGYSSPGKLIFSMEDYIKNMLNGIPEDMKWEYTTPYTQHLFDIAAQTSFITLWRNYYTYKREHVQLYIGKCHSYVPG